ncbi:unnamed protein product [marine sediment metagenome]|uniref:SMP-30/Gluconolactonase/LRE-like region domain-containing protein n=1 Tax=marine sediment metagenome TaxID=412755 RepID=X1A7E9_9ZZZZ
MRRFGSCYVVTALAMGLVILGPGCDEQRSASETPSTDPIKPAEKPPEPLLRQPDPPIKVEKVGFKKPESVLHDPQADLYLVSNIVGKALEKDERGFISKLSPDGKVLELKWIEGGRDGVKLNAPKGMAIAGDCFTWRTSMCSVFSSARVGSPKARSRSRALPSSTG